LRIGLGFGGSRRFIGYYRFDEIETGQTVTVSVSSKRFTFANPTRILNVAEAVEDVDFTAIE
jgi:hypothetical protein